MLASFYLIAGLGKTGHSIARYLQRRNKQFAVFDTRTKHGLNEFNQEFPGVEVFLGTFPVTLYSQLTGIISSPGVSLDEPCIKHAIDMGVPVFGDIECLAREITAPIIAITGTNGKSTVTTLIGEMAKFAGISVAVAGNIGTPVLDLLDDQRHYDLWVLELSSFQLELTQSLSPLAATILNITPDHLDRHHNFNIYREVKQSIYSNAAVCVYNRDDKETIPAINMITKDTPLISYGIDTPDAGCWGLITDDTTNYLAYGDTALISVDNLRIKGKHNWANALAACALAHIASIPIPCMIHVLQNFNGLSHRCQWVRTLDGVDWINDSKGTNIGATISAIAGIGGSMPGKIVLIAGGQGKGADFSELRTSMIDYIRTLVLIGEDADNMALALKNTVNICHAESLERAIFMAHSEAQAGDVVLLSPACASLDMFRDFNHRGEVFTAAVNLL